MPDEKKINLFENIPVPEAVAQLAAAAVIVLARWFRSLEQKEE